MSKGTIIAILAVVIAFFVGFTVGSQLKTKETGVDQEAAKKGELTQQQKSVLIDQMALAIQANSEEIAKKILADAQNKGTAQNALKIVAEKAKSAVPKGGSKRGRQEEDPNKIYKMNIGKSYTKGKANAPITIIEFSEFQCPFCSRGYNTMKQVEKEYGDKVRFVFKAKILPFHKKAPLAHNAAFAAGDQGKFWEMHDKIFENQKQMGREKYIEWAGEMGLDVAKFTADMDNEDKYKSLLSAESKDAEKAGVRGTPTFLVNGKKIRGAQPFDKFKTAIDEALKK